MQKSHFNRKGFGLIELLLIVVVLGLIGGVGVYLYHQEHKAVTATIASSTSSKSSAQTSKTSSTTTATSASPYAGWSQYCSAQEKSCFNYPTTWTTKNVGAVDPAGDGIQLTSPSGTMIWFQSAVSGLGGQCQPSAPDVSIYKVIAEPHVANLYVIESGTDGTTTHIGLVNGLNGQAPKLGDTGSCNLSTTFVSKHDPSIDAWLESNGPSSLKASDLSTAELILESYTY